MLNLENKINKEKIANEKFAISNFLDDFFGLMVIVLGLLVLAASYYFLLWPRFTQASDTIRQAEGSLNAEKTMLEHYQKQLVEYKFAYDSIGDIDKQKIGDVIGPRNKFDSIYKSDILVNYNNLLLANNFVVKKLEVEEASAGEGQNRLSRKNKDDLVTEEDKLPENIGKMIVSIEVANLNYSRLKELINLLESESRVADITEFSCNEGVEICTIKMDTYYFTSTQGQEN